MDVGFGVTSAGGLADVARLVFTSLYEYHGDVKSAPERSAELREELRTVFATLRDT
jgi:hypothetical protein